MAAEAGRVWLVDDEPALRQAIAATLASVGLDVRAYASAQAFLDETDRCRHGCLVTDVRMPGMSGIDLLERLQADATLPAAVVMTLHGDAPTAVRAMKAGAFDFIEKPFRDQLLIDAVHRALLHGEKAAKKRERRQLARAALATLTAREREVFDHIVQGSMNKEMARAMNLSVRTVELHRAHVMNKTGAESLSALVTMGLLARDEEL